MFLNNTNVGDLLSYFHSIKSETDFKRMITDHVKEDLYLEFKQKHDRRHGQLETDDKFNFSRALSGFANSDGGILVWGIETYKRDEAAKSLKPVSNVDDFIRSLKSSLIGSVQPFVDNVLIEKVSTDVSSEEGYVKCFIPHSEKTPHRAVLAEREYYKRSTEGFYRLEHFDLEDMFGRRQKPLLSVQIQSKDYSDGNDSEVKELIFRFTNEGRALARYYGFLCQFDNNIEIVSFSDHRLSDITRLNDGTPSVNFNDNTGVVHPNNIRYHMGTIRFKRIDKTKKIQGNISYYCEWMQAKSLNFEFD